MSVKLQEKATPDLYCKKKKTLLGAERGLRLGKGEDSLKHTVNVALGKGFTWVQVKKNKIKTNIYLIASNVFPNDLWMKPGARRRYLSSAREAEELSSSASIHKGSGEPMDSSKAA